MAKLSDLAQLAIDAYGGLDRWRRFETVSARLLSGGVLWPLKHQHDVPEDVRVRVVLRKKWASHCPFGAPDLRTSFQPHRAAIENAEGQTAGELLRPRDSFKGHSLDTPWTRLQLAYLAGYAMWTYLNTPFLFAWDGVETEEVGPWTENVQRVVAQDFKTASQEYILETLACLAEVAYQKSQLEGWMAPTEAPAPPHLRAQLRSDTEQALDELRPPRRVPAV